MLVEVRVQSLELDRSSNTPVVILEEVGGHRVLPIWIGPGEASAIAMQLADMKFSRPLTHDLLVSLMGGLGGNLNRVLITRVKENTYFAEMVIHRNGDVISVDARPSDSIAVALRTRARIFASDELLDQSPVQTAEEEPISGASSDDEPGGLSPEELKEYLRRMNPEDFGRFSP